MKELFKILCTTMIYFSFVGLHAFGQSTAENNDALISKIHYYGLKNSSSVLFAHFDKTIYVNNENAWFTAYLLNYNKKFNNPSILTVSLIKTLDKSEVFSQKFLMTGGVAFGNMTIPESIQPGDYSFVLYTNVVSAGRPVDEFVQPITIKLTTRPSVSASFELASAIHLAAGGDRSVLLTVIDKDGHPLPNADVVYHVGDHLHPTLSGKVKTDKEGKYLFSIPVTQIPTVNHTLEAQVIYHNESATAKIELPQIRQRYIVRFYPEGGNLINATQSQIGWEVQDLSGLPEKIIGILYKDKLACDTIYTDSYGVGRFQLIPQLNSKYDVKLVGKGYDTSYALPPALVRGPVITLKQAIANDSLKIRLVSKFQGRYTLIIHNYRQVFFTIPLIVPAAGKHVLINLAEVPKGLNAITVLDSLQRPCAERIFFAHFDNKTAIQITSDKESYTMRQKVQLKLRLGSVADSLKGFVSVACVQDSRLETRKGNDIESYFYLTHYFESLPLKERYMAQTAENKAFLENILLVRGWRRYLWQDVLKTQASDTVLTTARLNFDGQVKFNDKALKKPVELMIRNDSLIKTQATDSAGYFSLEDGDITTAIHKKIMLLLNKNKPNYKISLADNLEKMNSTVIKEFTPADYTILASNEANADQGILRGFEHAINLRTVTIQGSKNTYKSISPEYSYGANACGDYVCFMNVLNCPNHFDDSRNRPPAKGEKYIVLKNAVNNKTMTVIHPNPNNDGNSGEDQYSDIFYSGCTVPESSPCGLTFAGIKYSMEFYVEDYSYSSPSQPNYQSTLYWKHLALVNSKRELELNFYTSDITGTFKIVVQGMTTNDLIYGEKVFTVVPGKPVN